MRVNYIYKKESEARSFSSNGSNIELKEYMDDLVFYSPLNDLYRAEYALYDKAAIFEKKPEVFTGGVFGSYLKITDKYSFNIKNFESIEDNIRISFYLGSNKLINNSTIGLRKNNNFPDTGLPAGDYSLTVNVDGYPTSTMVLKISDGSTVKQVRNKILFSLDPVIYPFELNSANNETDLIVLQALYEGKTIKISDGLDGTNLLKYFDIEPVEYGTAPNFDNTIFQFRNLKIEHVKNTENGNAISFLKFTLFGDENQIIEFPWNNNAINLDNIEIDIDDNLIYIFVNGKIKVVEILKNKLIKNDTTLILSGDNGCQYSFDELIINKSCLHTKDFELDRKQLTKYTTKKPYIDYHFDGADLKNGMSLNSVAQSGIHCCLCDNGNFYYYSTGAWRPASGNFNNTNDWYTFAEKIKEYNFSNNEFFIRCFFVSDGVINSYLDIPYFEIDDEVYEDKEGNTSAILIGTKEWSINGEPLKEDLTGKSLNITTDQGTSSIEFETDFYTIDDVIKTINDYYPEGITKSSKDGEDRVILVSETKGKDAFITVSGDAAPIIFGSAGLTANGQDANTGTIDYTKFYDAVRNYTGSPLIPMEITDEQMKLFLKEALAYYKRWKGDEINQYTCQLKGNWKDGWEIPSVVENQKDIVDIIFRPIFPITFYGSDFIDNGTENIFALTIAESLFGGRGAVKNGQGITQDYYISLMGMQDFRQTLGLNPTWEIMNNRIYIFPSQVTRFTNVSIRYKAPLSEEDCLKDPDMIKYVHGKCLMTMGNIRGQYGSDLTTGEASLKFNADAWYERGKVLVDEVLDYWKKSQPPMGFFFG
jgi:hypothetical protein